MTSAQLDNCSRCNRVFSKVHDDKCPTCIDEEQDLFRSARGLLRRSRSHGGITVEELAVQAGCTPDDIEGFYHGGRFGNDVDMLMVVCPRCSETSKGSECEGKFCKVCAEAIKDEMGSEVLGRDELDEEGQAERDRLARLQENSKNHYGLSRNKGKDDWQFYKF